jgi:hypothetical protein
MGAACAVIAVLSAFDGRAELATPLLSIPPALFFIQYARTLRFPVNVSRVWLFAVTLLGVARLIDEFHCLDASGTYRGVFAGCEHFEPWYATGGFLLLEGSGSPYLWAVAIGLSAAIAAGVDFSVRRFWRTFSSWRAARGLTSGCS